MSHLIVSGCTEGSICTLSVRGLKLAVLGRLLCRLSLSLGLLLLGPRQLRKLGIGAVEESSGVEYCEKQKGNHHWEAVEGVCVLLCKRVLASGDIQAHGANTNLVEWDRV
jgi:hypothetical protein